MKKRSEKPSAHAEILLEIEKRFGTVTPRIVVDLARDENHPLHGEFEWRDGVAAEKFREEQARELIRGARLHVTVHEVSIEAQAFLRDPASPAHQQGYTSITRVAADERLASEAVAQELRQAAGLLRRARDIATACSIDAKEIEQHAEGVESLAAALATVSVAAENAA